MRIAGEGFLHGYMEANVEEVLKNQGAEADFHPVTLAARVSAYGGL